MERANLALADQFAREAIDKVKANDLAGAIELLRLADLLAPQVPNFRATKAMLQSRLAKASSKSPAKAQWDLEYEAKMAAYRLEAEKQRAAVAAYERAQADFVALQAQLAERARKERAEWERAVAACKTGDYSACNRTPQ